MRILADQDVYAATIRFMIGLGHDVTRAADLGLGPPRIRSCFARPGSGIMSCSRAIATSGGSSTLVAWARA
jgi:hypothetical protein